MLRIATACRFGLRRQQLSTAFSHKYADCAKPGFLLFESLEEIQTPPGDVNMAALFPNRWNHFLRNQRKPKLEALETVEQMKPALRFYENQEKCDHLTLLIGNNSFSFVGHNALVEPITTPLLKEEAEEWEELISTEEEETLKKPSMSLMSILKWRRRRMRGHKYKKRMKALRKKSKTN